jgi:hypothetical protein
MSWTDLYANHWKALNQHQVTSFEAEIREAIPNIEHGELNQALETIVDQDDPPGAAQLAELIKAQRKSNVIPFGRHECNACRDKGNLTYPSWYWIEGRGVFDSRDHVVHIGYDLPPEKKAKAGGDLFFDQNRQCPCICEKGREVAYNWWPRISVASAEDLLRFASKAYYWAISALRQKDELVPNTVRPTLDAAVKTTERKVKAKPTFKKKKKLNEPPKPERPPCLEDWMAEHPEHKEEQHARRELNESDLTDW